MVDMMELMDRVLYQIRRDVEDGEYAAIMELLSFVPTEKLEGYLPEVENLQIELDDISHINE